MVRLANKLSYSRRVLLQSVIVVAVGLIASTAQAATSLSLSWTAPTTRVDGSSVSLSGFRVYFRNVASAYNSTNKRDISGGTNTSYTFTDLTPGTYYFIVRALDSSNVESADSNEVPGSVSNTFAPVVETGGAASRTFTVELLTQGTSTVLNTLTLQSDAQGRLSLSPTVILPGTFDLRIKSVGFLARKITNLTPTFSATFSTMLAGDISGDNRVNSFDFEYLYNDFNQLNKSSDLNRDTRTNSVDFEYLYTNWNRLGE